MAGPRSRASSRVADRKARVDTTSSAAESAAAPTNTHLNTRAARFSFRFCSLVIGIARELTY